MIFNQNDMVYYPMYLPLTYSSTYFFNYIFTYLLPTYPPIFLLFIYLPIYLYLLIYLHTYVPIFFTFVQPTFEIFWFFKESPKVWNMFPLNMPKQPRKEKTRMDEGLHYWNIVEASSTFASIVQSWKFPWL
jgi:hypothetical protein